MDARTASSIFSRGRILRLSSGDTTYLSRIKESYLQSSFDLTPANILRLTYCKLASEYPFEYIIKNEIAKKLFLNLHGSDDATLISELRAGKSKADTVIFNGQSTCYEIKSKYDSHKRLNTQLKDYSKVFDRVFVVYASEIEQTIISNTPSSIGLIRVSKNQHLETVREPREGLKDINMMLDSLRTEEKLYICENLGSAIPRSTPNMKIGQAVREVIKKTDIEEFNKLYIHAMKAFRSSPKIWIKNLPKSLTAAATTYSFNKPQQEALLQIFK
ncbi:MAG: sce7726 family protein [Alcanivorax sp.]|nr:sce7726 family protein [Alcanivorax sp.]HIK74725.1 hypothetical protein [Alcanivorax sp.]